MSLFDRMLRGRGPAGGHRISGEEARRLVREESALLVDVRSPAEFGGGHADGAINLPLQQLGSRLSELPRDRPVVLYCRSGARSASAASMLSGQGFTVYDAGGLSSVMR